MAAKRAVGPVDEERVVERSGGTLYNSLRDANGDVDLATFQAKVSGDDLKYAEPVVRQIAQIHTTLQTEAEKRLTAARAVATVQGGT